VFSEKNIAVTEVVDARKEKIGRDEAWKIIAGASAVTIARGKKSLSFSPPGAGDKEEILKNAMGRSGNLRAPALRIGTKLLIGFNEELYSQL